MADGEVMTVLCLHQEGERHYNQGNVQGAIDSFQSALEKAKSTNESYLENICSYNLASVYAANGNKEELEKVLHKLQNQFIDMLQEGGNSIPYLRAVANRSRSYYEQALKVPNDSKNHTYLLEQLVKLHRKEQETRMETKYLEQLKEAYLVQRNDMRRFQVTCQLAKRYILDNRTEDAQKVLQELKKEVADDTMVRTGNMYLGTRPLRTDVQETRCLVNDLLAAVSVPLWNEMGLMFTFLAKYQKALECFETGLKLTNETQESILNTAVLKQNIGAVRNLNGLRKEDFELAIKFHLDAIETFGRRTPSPALSAADNYPRARERSNTRGKKLLRREKLENTCTGNDEILTYTLPTENNRRWVIYEARKDGQAACAGAARSFFNMGNAHIKLKEIMDAKDAFSQAYMYAQEAQDTRTEAQAYEALASISMQFRNSHEARKYLLTAVKVAVSTEGWRNDEGQGQQYTDVQRITDKLSKLPVTMSTEREDFNKTTGHWSTLSNSRRRRTLITTWRALSHRCADKGQGPSRRTLTWPRPPIDTVERKRELESEQEDEEEEMNSCSSSK